MRVRRYFLLGLVITQLGGCGTKFLEKVDDGVYGITGADDLVVYMDKNPPQIGATRADLNADPIQTGIKQKRYLLAEIDSSFRLCELYKRRLLFASRANNASFDIATTALSALATAFTPLATVHALSAAAAITSGTKTAIDADIYENATAPVMVQALQTVYDTPMASLHSKVRAAPNDVALATIADEGDIIAAHQKCSLTEAMVEIQKAQAAAAASKTDSAYQLPKPPFTSGTSFAMNDGSLVRLDTAVAASAPANFSLKYSTSNNKPSDATYGADKTDTLANFLALLASKLGKPMASGS